MFYSWRTDHSLTIFLAGNGASEPISFCSLFCDSSPFSFSISFSLAQCHSRNVFFVALGRFGRISDSIFRLRLTTARAFYGDYFVWIYPHCDFSRWLLMASWRDGGDFSCQHNSSNQFSLFLCFVFKDFFICQLRWLTRFLMDSPSLSDEIRLHLTKWHESMGSGWRNSFETRHLPFLNQVYR
jgi:hypothetical protein